MSTPTWTWCEHFWLTEVDGCDVTIYPDEVATLPPLIEAREALAATGLNPGEIVAIPSELPDPEGWEVYDPLGASGMDWWPVSDVGERADHRRICRPINKEKSDD